MPGEQEHRGRWRRTVPVAALGLVALAAVAILLLSGGQGGAPAPARAELPVGRPITIAWGGDTTLGSSHGLPPQRGWAALAPIARVLRAADLTAVNAEGTFSVGGASKCNGPDTDVCFAFQAPPSHAAALARAGVDVANLANNHAFDFGAPGMGQTITALRARHVDVTGRPGEILVRTIAGAKVAFVGFSTYPWSSPLADPAAVTALIGDARKRANVVVAFFHAGAEGVGQEHTPAGAETYLGEDRGSVRAFAHTAIDAGADLVLGSGPHVLRGIELYRNRVVAYSLGNLAGYRNFATGGTLSLSGILRVTVDDDGAFLTGTFTALRLDAAGIPHLDPTGEARRLVGALSRDDFGAGAPTIAPDGTLRRRVGD